MKNRKERKEVTAERLMVLQYLDLAFRVFDPNSFLECAVEIERTHPDSVGDVAMFLYRAQEFPPLHYAGFQDQVEDAIRKIGG